MTAEQVEKFKEEVGVDISNQPKGNLRACAQKNIQQNMVFGGGIQKGFTLIELISVITIVAIISVVALPRLFDRDTFDSRGFYDQAISTLRYAQKSAIAQHKFVCVTFTANSLLLKYGATSACPSDLTSPLGQSPYVVTAPNGVTMSGYANFNFDALGKATPGQDITVSGNINHIIVEAETGYVH